jgi:NAD(P)-dependent dehydrogenase (short-subunit alcohol dehydrogenase family)
MSSGSLLSGTVALVSGVGPGLGRAIAICAAEHGADVVLGARSADQLEFAAADVRAAGRAVAFAPTDVTDPVACRALADLAVERFGRIDALVLNATRRSHSGSPVAEADMTDWRRSMDVNLWGAISMIQAVLPTMRAQRSGKIVLVGAMTTRVVPAPGRGDYAVSKAAANQLTRNLAYEVGADAIRVNAVIPGWMDGPTVQDLLDDDPHGRMRAMYDQAIAAMPLGRMPTPREVAGSVVFFASELSAPVTGQSLDVNAGQYMHP